jgi:hypothetical protein
MPIQAMPVGMAAVVQVDLIRVKQVKVLLAALAAVQAALLETIHRLQQVQKAETAALALLPGAYLQALLVAQVVILLKAVEIKPMLKVVEQPLTATKVAVAVPEQV